MQVIYDPTTAAADGETPPTADVDIIFVHGLNPKGNEDHPTSTWTHKGTKKTFWPKAILPVLVPTARVLLFSYNSSVVYKASNSRVADHALGLLHTLQAVRKTEEQLRTPIVFICHSLGGLVVKQALVTAKLNDRFEEIIRQTYGIIFFGTPHRGGNAASVANYASRALGFFTGEPPSNLLPVLQKKSIFADSLSQSFQNISQDYKVVSFFEQFPATLRVKGRFMRTKLTQMYVVESESARLFADNHERETVLGISADHSGICKFEDIEDHSFNEARKPLLELISYARAMGGSFSSMPDWNRPQLDTLSFGIPGILVDKLEDRQDLLRELDELVESAHSASRYCRLLLWGPSGVGKTTCAVRLAESRATKLPCPIIWLDARSLETLKRSTESMRSAWMLTNEIAWRRFLNNHRGLLVLDDISDHLSVTKYLQAHYRENLARFEWDIVATGRDSSIVGTSIFENGLNISSLDLNGACRVLALGLIPQGRGWTQEQIAIIRGRLKVCLNNSSGTARDREDEQVAQALEQFYGIAAYSDLEELASILGCHPLALTQCAAYMKAYFITAKQYRIKFTSCSRPMLLDLYGYTQNSILASFEISIQRLEASEPDAARLLVFLSCLDRSSITFEFLENILSPTTFWNNSESFSLRPDLRRRFDFLDPKLPGFHKNIAILESLCFITRDSKRSSIRIHSQIHELSHLRNRSSDAASHLNDVINLLLHRLPPLLYSCLDKLAPRMQSLVTSHAERTLHLMQIYSTDHPTVETDTWSFFLECYLWTRNAEFLALAEQLEERVPGEDRNWISSISGVAGIVHLIEQYQASSTGALSVDDVQRYLSKICPAEVPLDSRSSLTKAYLSYRLSQLIKDREDIGDREHSLEAAQESLRVIIDSLPMAKVLVDGSVSASDVQSLQGLPRKSQPKKSLREPVARAILAEQTVRGLLGPRIKASNQSSSRQEWRVFERPLPRDQNRFWTACASEAIDTSTQIAILGANIGDVSQALRLGIVELKSYFAFVIEMVLSEENPSIGAKEQRLISTSFLGILESQSGATPDLARAQWPPWKALSTMDSLFTSRMLYPEDPAMQKALELLVNHPLLVGEVRSHILSPFPHSRCFSTTNDYTSWIRRTLNSFHAYGMHLLSSVNSGGTVLSEPVALALAKELGQVLNRTTETEELHSLFRNAIAATDDPRNKGLWAMNDKLSWANTYFSVMHECSLFEHALDLCNEMCAATDRDPYSSWTERQYSCALNCGDKKTALSVAKDALRVLRLQQAELKPDEDDPWISWREESRWSLRVHKLEQFSVEMLQKMMLTWKKWLSQHKQNYSLKDHDCFMEWAELLEVALKAAQAGKDFEDIGLEELDRTVEATVEPLDLGYSKRYTDWKTRFRSTPWRTEEYRLKIEEQEKRRKEEQLRLAEERKMMNAKMKALATAPFEEDQWSRTVSWNIQAYTAASRHLHRVGGSLSNMEISKLGFDIEALDDTIGTWEQGLSMLFESSFETGIGHLGVPIGRVLGSCTTNLHRAFCHGRSEGLWMVYDDIQGRKRKMLLWTRSSFAGIYFVPVDEGTTLTSVFSLDDKSARFPYLYSLRDPICVNRHKQPGSLVFTIYSHLDAEELHEVFHNFASMKF